MRSPEAVSAMLCPVCKVGLSMTDRQGIEIDYCPQCRGVWLDRGELDKIIERSVPAAAPRAAAQPAPAPERRPQTWGGDTFGDDRYHGGYDPRYVKQKKRKSWLEEIFD